MTLVGGGATKAKCSITGWNAAAKPCDYCNSTAALLYCHADSAFMCIACDSKVHNPNDKLACADHARVYICDVCEQAPAAFTCKADAASLCVICDRDIHSANPLARRHERVAVVPFYNTAESLIMKSSESTRLVNDDYIPETWIPPNSKVNSGDAPELKSMEFLLSESDQFLEFENYQFFSDSIVPVQTTMKQHVVPTELVNNDYSSENRLEIDFTRSNNFNGSYSYTTPSLSHSVSSSSMDVGVVPDGSALSDTSYTFAQNLSSDIDMTRNQGPQVVGMDREARVLRYKEKRKNRKFEKTIRYASRKAYAETRPRIKGRFAKRIDIESESDMDQIFGVGSANFVADARYGIVPSF
ncbi:hypothetical protein ACJIZ3_005432 [Penstemon smallii]|uniref:Uncharacterized protein n=1 Tax=Penstemon smallii TaxID=265156 RepID=A0ABD3S500_9LAMI